MTGANVISKQESLPKIPVGIFRRLGNYAFRKLCISDLWAYVSGEFEPLFKERVSSRISEGTV